MEVGIAVEVRHFLIFKSRVYMHFLKFTQICIIFTDLPCYKEYIETIKLDIVFVRSSQEFGLHFFKHGGWNKAMEAGFFGSN